MDLSFVSSASELLEQFQRVQVDEAVHYELWLSLSHRESSDAARERARSLISQILQLVADRTSGYIWELDDFNLFLHSYDASGHRLCLRGRTRFGENIEDEWLVVWLLFEVSRAFPDLMIQVWDNDGQFLLIEASHVLPAWVRPENTENRLWLKIGHLHLLRPTSEQLRQSKRGKGVPSLSVSEAMQMMQSSHSHVSQDIQEAVLSRISQFPAQISESMHHTACIMPYAIANIVDKQPASVPLAVRAFGDRKQEEVAAFARKRYDNEPFVAVRVKMSRWQYAQLMFHQMHPPKSFASAASKIGNDADALKASELGSKLACGYEILLRRNRELARDDQSIEGSVQEQAWKQYLKKLQAMDYFAGELEGSTAYKQKLATAKSFFLHHRSNPAHSDDDVHVGVSRADQVLYNVCELAHQQSVETNGELGIAIDSKSLAAASDDDSWMHTAPSDFEAEMQRIANKMSADLQIGDRDSAQGVDESTVAKDLSALQHIVAGFADFMATTSGLEGAEIKRRAVQTDFSTFDAKKFESVLRDSAGYAIQNGKLKRTPAADKLDEAEATVADKKLPGAGGAAAQEDDEYFSEDDYEEDTGGDDGDDDDDEEEGEETKRKPENPVREKSTGAATQRKVRFADEMENEEPAAATTSSSSHSIRTGVGFIADSADLDDDNSAHSDSDDESAAVDSDDEPALPTLPDTSEDDGEFLRQYMAAMDAQLRGTTLEKSFEPGRRRKPQEEEAPSLGDEEPDDDDRESADSDDELPVDVDANLLKYMLESFNAQMGQSGPASNLMRELGLDIPISSAVELELGDDDGDDGDDVSGMRRR